MPRKYWRISPKVTNQEKITQNWIREIITSESAMMGWSPDDYDHSQLGPKFAGNTNNSVQNGDLVLIARSHHKSPQVVCCGVIDSMYQKKKYPFSDIHVYTRKLRPFIPISEIPEGIPFISTMQSRKAIEQLQPDSDHLDNIWQVCNWMEELLADFDNNLDKHITETDIPESSTFNYKVKTNKQISQARRLEAQLVKQYYEWLHQQGKLLSSLKYNSLQCDCWENQRGNLIEAKSSDSRENIRMAVGQLFDYAYQGKEKCQNPNMAILLPEKPNFSMLEWLDPLNISVIWKEDGSFVDNVDGQFV